MLYLIFLWPIRITAIEMASVIFSPISSQCPQFNTLTGRSEPSSPSQVERKAAWYSQKRFKVLCVEVTKYISSQQGKGVLWHIQKLMNCFSVTSYTCHGWYEWPQMRSGLIFLLPQQSVLELSSAGPCSKLLLMVLFCYRYKNLVFHSPALLEPEYQLGMP